MFADSLHDSPTRPIRPLPRALPALVAGLLGAVTAGAPLPGAAAAPVTPGGELVLTSVDGGSITCRRGTQEGGSSFLDCLGSGTAGTTADPGDNFVRARSHASLTPVSFGTALGVPNYATARLYKDIEIQGGPPDALVLAEVAAVFDYKNFFFLGASYVAASSVTLQVIDLDTGVPVGTTTLFETNRDGDQGFTDVALADQRLVIPGASGNLHVLLQRGRSYRLLFELEVMSQVLAVGLVEADASATLTSLTVRVDEDEVEELAVHDAAVRSELATHDTDVKALLAKLLAGQEELKANQREIIRLLLTPQGQRASDVIGGEWPLHTPPGQAKQSKVTPSPAEATTSSRSWRSRR
jgi:hypothetical protein